MRDTTEGLWNTPETADSAAGWESMRQAVASECATLAAFGRMAVAEPGDYDPRRALHAWLKQGQDPVAVTSAALSAFDATRATIRRGRNKRGATAEVTAAGAVPKLTGRDPFRDQDDAATPLVTVDAITLTAIADAWARANGCEDLPAIIGGVESRQWQQMVDASADVTGAVALALHRCGLSAGASHLLDRFADGHRGAPAREVVKRKPRLSVRRPALRKSDLDAVTQAWAVDGAGSASLVPLARPYRRFGPSGARGGSLTATGHLVTYADTGALVAPSSRKVTRVAHMWDGSTTVVRTAITRARREQPNRVAVGHCWQDRPSLFVRTTNTARARIAAAARRTEARAAAAAAVASDQGDALTTAWHDCHQGESIVATLPGGGTVTFTRRDGRPVTFRWQHGERSGRFTARTPVAAAMALARVSS
jgi:hypothetical protein